MDPEAEAWVTRLAEELGVPPLSDAQRERLLSVSRRVAHGVERAATPLSAYLAGMGVAAKIADGSNPAGAFDQVIDRLLELLPPAESP
jgi:Domain of unknown function (DUF6457)